MIAEARNSCTEVVGSYRRGGVTCSVDQQPSMLPKKMVISRGLVHTLNDQGNLKFAGSIIHKYEVCMLPWSTFCGYNKVSQHLVDLDSKTEKERKWLCAGGELCTL